MEVGGWLLYVRPPRLAPPVPVLDQLARSWGLWLNMATRDWHRDLYTIAKTVVFVGRYGGQDIERVEGWPLSKVIRTARIVGEYIAEEAKKGASPRGMSPRAGAW